MNNIDCDQIILFGLVAIFAIYVYRNILDPNQQGFVGGNKIENFKIGGQTNPNNNNNAEAIAQINSQLNTMNNQNAGISQQIQDALGNINNAASNFENSANSTRLASSSAASAISNAASAITGATAAMNTTGSPISNTQNNNISGNDNSNSGPAPFNSPEPNANPNGDSVPKSYNVGENKATSCFPQDTLTAEDLLPAEDVNTIKQFSEESIGDGVLKGIELLGAGYHVGVNSVGQSLRNANKQLRSEPPNPQTDVSPWMNSTIAPDLQRRPLELTESCAKATNSNNTDDVPGNNISNNNLSDSNFENSLTDNSLTDNSNNEPVAANSR